MRSIAIFASLCLSVCLSAGMCQKPHIQSSRNFLCMLPVVVTRSSFNDSAICYVFPVLQMTSCFHMMEQIVIQAIHKLFTVTRQGASGAKSDLTDRLVLFLEMFSCKYGQHDNILECGPMPNVMAALPNIGAALCTTLQFC